MVTKFKHLKGGQKFQLRTSFENWDDVLIKLHDPDGDVVAAHIDDGVVCWVNQEDEVEPID